MKIKHIISDADGVLINSQELAWKNAHKIVSLFYSTNPFSSLSEFKKHFSRESQIKLVGEQESDTLRAIHRLLMRHTSKQIQYFDEVMNVYESFKIRKTIVTSAFASGIREILDDRVEEFSEILGRESGRKLEILTKLSLGNEIYITDGVRDIEICKKVKMPVIAVGWGYDDVYQLVAANPNFFAPNPKDLSLILENLI